MRGRAATVGEATVSAAAAANARVKKSREVIMMSTAMAEERKCTGRGEGGEGGVVGCSD